MSEAVVVVSDEGLGGVPAFGRGARELGLTPLLITAPVPPGRVEAWREVYADVAVVDDPYEPAGLAAAAVDLAADRALAGLFSCYDGLVVPAARAAAELGLPHPNLDGLARSRNKLATRRVTCRQGVPTPRFATVSAPGECAAAGAALGFPAVLKPLNGMASHLVRRVGDEAELRAAYREIVQCLPGGFAGNYRHLPAADVDGTEATPLDARRTLLLEEHLEGPEYSAEVLVREGTVHRVALFHKFLIDPRGYLECGFTSPAFASPERVEAVWCHVEECLAALEVDGAAAHVEVIDTDSGPRLVEVNAGRAGGQILVQAVREALGVDLIGEILTLQLGRPRPRPSAPALEGRVSTLTVFPPASGRLASLGGLDRLEELPGVERVVPFCAPGDDLAVDDRELFAVNLLVAGGDEEELRALHDRACRTVTFGIVPRAAEAAS